MNHPETKSQASNLSNGGGGYRHGRKPELALTGVTRYPCASW